MIGIGAAGARGTNGTLRPATARTRSGCSTASCHVDVRAPVVADEDRRLLADVVEQPAHVAAQRHHVVGLDLRRRRAAPKPRMSGASTR